MSRRLTTGFEENSTATSIWANSTGSPTFGTTNPHSGTYRLDTASGASTSFLRAQTNSATSGTIYTRFYWRTDDATPTAETILFQVLSGGAVAAWSISLNTDATIKLTNNVLSESATTTATVSADTWYRFEVRHVVSDTVGEIEMRLYLGDSTTEIETEQIGALNDDTLPSTVALYHIGKSTATGSLTFSYDDLVINDSGGAAPTSWPGPGKTFLLKPNSDVAIAWEDDDNVAAATFANIDDVPGTISDTDYNVEDDTLDVFDRLGLTDLGAEVPADADIKWLDLYARVGSDQTSSNPFRFKIWDEGGTPTNGASITALVIGWHGVYNNRSGDGQHLMYDASSKTKANIDSFNVGYETLTENATFDRRISALWVNVEWLESSGAAPGYIIGGGYSLGGIIG